MDVPQGATSAAGEAEDPCGGATGGAAAEEEAEDERDVQATATAADARKVTINQYALSEGCVNNQSSMGVGGL